MGKLSEEQVCGEWSSVGCYILRYLLNTVLELLRQELAPSKQSNQLWLVEAGKLLLRQSLIAHKITREVKFTSLGNGLFVPREMSSESRCRTSLIRTLLLPPAVEFSSLLS